MFKKIKNVLNVKKNIRKAKAELADDIRFYFPMYEHFREGYGEGVRDFFNEKKESFRYLEMQVRLWCVFLDNKFDTFFAEMIRESEGWEELGRNFGYLYFHVDELLAH